MDKQKKEALHCSFQCKLCGTALSLPACCDPDDITIKDGLLICNLCGSNKKVPICCGDTMKIAANL